MARFTNIGMPKKRFVASTAEEKEAAAESNEQRQQQSEAGPSKKRKGWGRDPEIASTSKERLLPALSASAICN